MNHRFEKDTLGTVKVPRNMLYGAQTARAVINFPIREDRFSISFIRVLALIKYACAKANAELKVISQKKAKAIMRSSLEVFSGKHNDQFPISVWQSGSGTQINMNMNEVIANRSIQFLKGKMGDKSVVHPNDDVNKGQSSNDVIPTAMHISSVLAVINKLIPSLVKLYSSLDRKSKEFKKVVKIGRTHLMDATPLSLGSEFSAYAKQIENNIVRIKQCLPGLFQLALGGTAVGTGVNTHPRFSNKAIGYICKMTKQPFKSSANKYESIASHDSLVQLSGSLKTIAVSLTKIANDIRFLASGPRCGINELILPANEPGSSIMPGKVNPTQCESLAMVCAQVIGYDAAITIAGAGGHFQLNAYKPLIIYNILKSIDLLTEGMTSFTDRCIKGIRPNNKKIKEHLDHSLMLVTALVPEIGYDKAAKISSIAFDKNITLRKAALESGFIDEKTFDNLVNFNKMIPCHERSY